MKKFISLLLSVSVVATFAFFAIASGSESDKTVTQAGGNAVASDETNQDLGQYKVEIKTARLTKDYEGKKVVVITYGFTNNADNATAFTWAFDDKVYQNGVSLEKCYVVADGDPYDEANQNKEIKKGVSLDVEVAYVLNNDTTPVDVEVKELISFSDKTITKTFNIE